MPQEQESFLRWLSKLVPSFRKPNGAINWRLVGAVTYAGAVWTILGAVVGSYKFGHFKVPDPLAEAPGKEKPQDKEERVQMLCEDIAENVYSSETFMG